MPVGSKGSLSQGLSIMGICICDLLGVVHEYKGIADVYNENLYIPMGKLILKIMP